MSFVYVTETGAGITLHGGKVVIEKNGHRISEIPKNTLDGLVILGSVQLTSQVMVEFLRLGVPVTWVSQTHRNHGRLVSGSNVNVMRQSRQVRLQDSRFYLELGKRVVAAKVHNQKVMLRRYNRRRDSSIVEASIKMIDIFAKNISSASDTRQLMGYEGIIARNYFTALGQMVPQEFSFEKRTRRPPEDPFNAMLGLGYSMLFSELYTAIENEGLHPYFGFLHALKEHHPALVSDLMEEWRPVLIDSLVMSLISHKEIRTSCFEHRIGGGIFLNEEGRKIFLNAYEKKMKTISERQHSYRHFLGMQAASYARALTAEDVRKYEPFQIR